MRHRRVNVCILMALICLVLCGGCDDAVSDGLVAGIEGGFSTGLSALISGAFQGIAASAFGVDAGGSATGGPPF